MAPLRQFAGDARVQKVWRVIRSANGILSWVSALVLGVWMAQTMHPLTPATLLNQARALQIDYADLYGSLHEQPFGYCTTYLEQRAQALVSVDERIKTLPTGGAIAQLRATIGLYDAVMREHYESDCRVAWIAYQNPANFQKVFGTNYPLYFVLTKWNLTEIHLALAQFVTSWLGLMSLALLAVYFWRSPLAPFAALALTSAAVKGSFAIGLVMGLTGAGTYSFVPGRFLYPATTVLLIIALIQPALTAPGRRFPTWLTALIAVIFAAHSMLYYVVDPPTARMFTLVGLAYLGAVGLLYRQWQVLLGALLALAIQLPLDATFKAPGQEIYAVLTTTNHLASQAYNGIMVYMGLLERPSPLGLFYMDETFAWVLDQNPILTRVAPHVVVHHSFQYSGSALLREAITTEPLTVLDAVWRRLLVQVFYRPISYVFAWKGDWVFTATILSLFVVNILALARRSLFLVITPVTLCVLVNQFAVNTVMTLVHTHARWNMLGVMVMFAVAPLYLFTAVKLSWWTAFNWRSLIAGRRPSIWVAGVVTVVALTAVIAQKGSETLRQERPFVESWMAVHIPPKDFDILRVVDNLETVRQAGDPRGEVAMWITTILRMHDWRYSTLTDDRRRELAALRNHYYRLAIAAAPDNPHFLFTAYFLKIDDWQTYLRTAIERFPGSIYAPGAAASLRYYGGETDPAKQAPLVAQYDVLASRFLSETSSGIPGFARTPAVERVRAGSPRVSQVRGADGVDRLHLFLNAADEVLLSSKPSYESASVHFAAHLDVLEGTLDAGIALYADGTEPRIVAQRALYKDEQAIAGRYHFLSTTTEAGETRFGLWIRGGPGGAVVELRDYYPIADFPKYHYRSGLMDRVRQRTP